MSGPFVSKIDTLRPAFGPRVKFAQVSLPDMPFANWADVVFSTATFHWILDHERLFQRLHAALRPGGRLAVLEIPKMDEGLLRPFARFHFTQVVPRLGRLISGHRSAYTYLPLSVDHFMTPREFTAHLVGLGFEVTEVRMLMFGTVAMHVARKPLLGEPRAAR